jgi:nickel/cobalt transporter (NicO) family protein
VNSEFALLLAASATLGFVHTLLGPDHYVPFIAMAAARRWSTRRAILMTLVSGLGHVTSSIVLGVVGLLLGVEVFKLTKLEVLRDGVAGWLLLGFGLAYTLWSLQRLMKEKTSGIVHAHESVAESGHAPVPHAHGPHTHVHPEKATLTPWVLVSIFVLGPCKPLIPVLMYPAARADAFTVFAVAMIFSLATIGTMIVVVYASLHGLAWVPKWKFQRYSHAVAGCVIMLCGAGIQVLSW